MPEKPSASIVVSRQPGGREALGTGQIKGGMLKSHLQWLQAKKSSEEAVKLMATLSPASRKDLSSILASAWYPFRTLIEFDRAIGTMFGGNEPVEVIRDLGQYSAQINLSTTYRAFQREDLHEFFGSSAVLHSQFQNFGTAVYERLGPSKGIMRYSKYTSFSPVYCESALGFFGRASVVQGAPMAIVTELTCQCHGATTCDFEIRWG